MFHKQVGLEMHVCLRYTEASRKHSFFPQNLVCTVRGSYGKSQPPKKPLCLSLSLSLLLSPRFSHKKPGEPHRFPQIAESCRGSNF